MKKLSLLLAMILFMAVPAYAGIQFNPECKIQPDAKPGTTRIGAFITQCLGDATMVLRPVSGNNVGNIAAEGMTTKPLFSTMLSDFKIDMLDVGWVIATNFDAGSRASGQFVVRPFSYGSLGPFLSYNFTDKNFQIGTKYSFVFGTSKAVDTLGNAWTGLTSIFAK